MTASLYAISSFLPAISFLHYHPWFLHLVDHVQKFMIMCIEFVDEEIQSIYQSILESDQVRDCMTFVCGITPRLFYIILMIHNTMASMQKIDNTPQYYHNAHLYHPNKPQYPKIITKHTGRKTGTLFPSKKHIDDTQILVHDKSITLSNVFLMIHDLFQIDIMIVA